MAWVRDELELSCKGLCERQQTAQLIDSTDLKD